MSPRKNASVSLAGKHLVQVRRISRVNGRSGSSFLSPEEQANACAAFCDREHTEIVASVDELDSVSGGSVEREGLQYALWLCDDGQADGIIVAKLDRFARTVLGGLKVIADLEDRGHLLLSAREGVIVGDERAASTDKLTRTLFLMLAQWQRDTLAESWEATRARHIANGVAAKEPYGYRRDGNRRLVPDPDEAKFAREMFEMRAQGKGWVAIAQKMNKAGAKPRRAQRFTHARISSIIENRVYLGEIRSGEFVNTHAHEPIVKVALFDAANKTRSLRVATDAQTSLLAGIVRCASCGQKMRSEAHGKHRYYRCRVRHGWGDCPDPVNVPADALDAFVEGRFKQDFFGFGAEAAYDDDALRIAQEALDDAEAELRTWVTVMSIRDEGFRAGYDVRNQAVAQARDALTKAQTAARGFALPADLDKIWDTLLDEDMRSFLAGAFEMVAVRSGRGWRENVAARSCIWARNEVGAPDVPLAFSPIIWDDAPAGAGEAVA